MASDVSADSRRSFLKTAAGIGSAISLNAAPPNPLPTVKFGDTEITRLIIGSNAFYGYSHFNNLLNQFMREYMTQDRRMEVLHRCERAGINTWQLHYNRETIDDLRRYRSEGGKMNWFLLADFDMLTDWTLVGKVVKELKPVGIAYHGNRSDDRYKEGRMQVIRDFCKVVRDAGVLVGVSAHNPAVFEAIESADWDVDYFQTCAYHVSRSREHAREVFNESPLDSGGMFMENDPVRMFKVVRQTKRPCLAFKILAAGRMDRPKDVEGAFQMAFRNIKPTDAVIVGMCPRFKDEISENVALTAKYGKLA